MIRFCHGGKVIELPAGELWASAPPDSVYRDTPAKELLAVVRNIENGTPWRDAVAQRYGTSNPWLHQIVTSPNRDRFFQLHPPPPGAHILDIGAGWGQISIPLARRCAVTALEPTPERMAFIRAAARQEAVTDHMHFVQADLFDVQLERSFDMICCIGVLEWVPKFRPGNPLDVQIDFLRRMRALLSPNGQLLIGIENRFGLKYLLGAPDDHLGAANVAVYGAPLAASKWRAQAGEELRSFTYTRAELEEMLPLAGLIIRQFFAALPDYKLPQQILPLSAMNAFFRDGRYVEEHDGSCGRPLDNQAELRSHYQSLAKLGIAGDFAPSFYLIASAA